MNLSAHEQEVYQKLTSEWVTQTKLKTSRGTMTRLVSAKLAEAKLNPASSPLVPQSGKVYRRRGELTKINKS